MNQPMPVFLWTEKKTVSRLLYDNCTKVEVEEMSMFLYCTAVLHSGTVNVEKKRLSSFHCNVSYCTVRYFYAL